MEDFVHLHVHSHYSLLDGASRVKDLVARAKAAGMRSLALTDHGNLFGAIDFHSAARDAGLKPILGMEAYISPTTRQDRSMRNPSTAAYHLLLLAMNGVGWRNLLQLSSRAYLEGFYYKPRIDRELLAAHSEGLICTTACLGGEVPQALLCGQEDKARQIAGEYLEIFGRERFFIEVQSQGIDEQDQVNPGLMALARELDVGVVGTNDVHFLRREDKASHEVLTCISTGKTLSEGALEYPPELYLKGPQEMRQALRDLPGAADATLKIAEMCELDPLSHNEHLPVFHTPAGETPEAYLRRRADEGLRERFDGGEPPQEYRQRLQRELEVIEDKGYSSYFLIVDDFVRFARENDIPSSPRGSGVATLLGYVLGIADVDPLRYGLLFERFTDPQREEAPDIDIDMCQEGRARVIQYVREKYGHVAQVITYTTLGAKAALRDVGRVLEVPLPDVDALCKKVPDGLGVSLKDALEQGGEFKDAYESEPTARRMIDFGLALEGLARNSSVHAAAVIIADEPLENIVPLCRQADSEGAITQWDGPTCEKVGLMKMDFLGLRTLTILQRTREMVRRRTGEDIDPEKLPLDDPQVYELFCRGYTDGVFQFESAGMKRELMKMRPDRIEVLIAANALYRPGPMELIDTYVARKDGREEIPSIHPLVDDLLAETYGIMAYQEQVMQVVNRLGKIPLNRALTLIKAISKKKQDKIAKERPNFLAGAAENGISEAEAEKLFELILKFAGYGFNKAHSTRYAILAYQMAYFKVHHPREFLAATLTYECSDTEKVKQYMAEADRMGVQIAPPDVNTCRREFTVDGDSVRFGLAAVKGVGAKAVDAIVEARAADGPFRDLFDFCERVDLRAVNRATIEALIRCGAFDSMGAHRAAMMAAVEDAIAAGQQSAQLRRSGQMSFLDIMGEAERPAAAASFPDVRPWSEAELLAAEKETLGFYVTSHPLVRCALAVDSLRSPATAEFAQLKHLGDRTALTVGCMIAEKRVLTTRNGRSAGKPMAMLKLEDLTGSCDAVAFSDTYAQCSHLLEPQQIVFVLGRLDRSREAPSIVIDEILPYARGIQELTGEVVLRLWPPDELAEKLPALKGLLAAHRGGAPLTLEVPCSRRPDVTALVRTEKSWSVQPSEAFLDEAAQLLQEARHVRLRPRPQKNSGKKSFSRRPSRQPASGSDGPASAAVTRFN
jgi:DNA polymerase-3 subunit alpha